MAFFAYEDAEKIGTAEDAEDAEQKILSVLISSAVASFGT
jgi:hypothetical protein